MGRRKPKVYNTSKLYRYILFFKIVLTKLCSCVRACVRACVRVNPKNGYDSVQRRILIHGE